MSVLPRSLAKVLLALTLTSLTVLRPGDANEVVEASRAIQQLRHQPAVLALSRQLLPTLKRRKCAPAPRVERGAYVLTDRPSGTPEVILKELLRKYGFEMERVAAGAKELLGEGVRQRVSSPHADEP
jgi:transketolase